MTFSMTETSRATHQIKNLVWWFANDSQYLLKKSVKDVMMIDANRSKSVASSADSSSFEAARKRHQLQTLDESPARSEETRQQKSGIVNTKDMADAVRMPAKRAKCCSRCESLVDWDLVGMGPEYVDMICATVASQQRLIDINQGKDSFDDITKDLDEKVQGEQERQFIDQGPHVPGEEDVTQLTAKANVVTMDDSSESMWATFCDCSDFVFYFGGLFCFCDAYQ
jgi:hypothetical protein